jgi:hypothetical protein
MRILLVEDEPSAATMLAKGLREEAYAVDVAADGGINVEGIAWDPQSKRLLLGLRSPVVDGQALLVPLKLRDPKAAFSFDNLEVEGRRAIRLSLGGAGIRSIEYDDSRKAFFMITGAGPNSEKMDFKLWEWSGNGAAMARCPRCVSWKRLTAVSNLKA